MSQIRQRRCNRRVLLTVSFLQELLSYYDDGQGQQQQQQRRLIRLSSPFWMSWEIFVDNFWGCHSLWRVQFWGPLLTKRGRRLVPCQFVWPWSGVRRTTPRPPLFLVFVPSLFFASRYYWYSTSCQPRVFLLVAVYFGHSSRFLLYCSTTTTI